MLGVLDGGIRDASRELFGKELNQLADGFGCNQTSTLSDGKLVFKNVALREQLRCIQGIDGNLKAILNGTPPPGSTAPLQVPLGVASSNGQMETCKGLRDCLQKAHELEGKSKQRVDTLKGSQEFQDSRCAATGGMCPGLAKFKEKTDKQVEDAMEAVAKAFERRVAVYKAQKDRLRSLLEKEDITVPSDPKGVKRSFKCRSGSIDEVCAIPDDFSEQLTSMTGAGDLDDDLSGPKQAAKSKEDSLADAEKSIKDNLTAIKTAKGKCQQEATKNKREKKKAIAAELRTVGEGLDSAYNACANTANAQGLVFSTTAIGEAIQGCVAKVDSLSAAMAEICAAEDGETKPASCTAIEAKVAETKVKCSESCKRIFEERAKASVNPSPTGATGASATPAVGQTGAGIH
jgi:hypothetical protein